MKIDLGDAQLVCQFDPAIDGLFGQVAKVEQIRAVVVGAVEGPGTTDI